MTERDRWLAAVDEELLRECEERAHRAGGPGGQRRNKVETAVELLHRPTGLRVQARESRSREENRRRALRRLRQRLAHELRQPFPPSEDGALERVEKYVREGRLRISPSNPEYPLVAAILLDALAVRGLRGAAAAFGLTPSQLDRFLRNDRELFRAAARLAPRGPGAVESEPNHREEERL